MTVRKFWSSLSLVSCICSVPWFSGAPPALLLQNAVHSAWRRARQWQGSVQLLREMQELQPRSLKALEMWRLVRLFWSKSMKRIQGTLLIPIFHDFSAWKCSVYSLYQCLSSISIYDLRPGDPKVDYVALVISEKFRVGHQTEIKIPII